MTTGLFAGGNGAGRLLTRLRARTRQDLIAEGGRFRPPLRAYLGAMVVMFVVVSGIGVVYERVRSTRDAADAATTDAEFGAAAAARQISLDLRSVRAMVSDLASNPQIARSFDPGPPACALEYSGAPAFSAGHLDVLAADGTVACSSLEAAPPIGYEHAAWISGALVRPSTSGPVEDLRTGKEVVVVSAPVPGRGLVAAFLDLDALGPGLLSTFGGPGDSSSWWSPVTVSSP